MSIAQSVIFCNTRQRAEELGRSLNDEHHTVSLMHAEMPKGERSKVMAAFRNGEARVLVTTDIIARGIDVQHVSIVLNYDLPSKRENYLHRIGRSGRFGRKGVAINFVSSKDAKVLRELERHYGTTVEELPLDFAAHLE